MMTNGSIKALHTSKIISIRGTLVSSSDGMRIWWKDIKKRQQEVEEAPEPLLSADKRNDEVHDSCNNEDLHGVYTRALNAQSINYYPASTRACIT